MPGADAMHRQEGSRSVPAYEVVLRRPNRQNKIRYKNRADAEIGDVLELDGKPWVIIEKEPAFELRRIERIICVPCRVRNPR